MTSTKVRVAIPSSALVGEGPVWRSQDRTLVWVDIPRGSIYESNVATGETATTYLSTQVGAVALCESGALLVAHEEGFGTLNDRHFDRRLRVLDSAYRMNDAKCDAAGRLWAGSTPVEFTPGRGVLHVLTPGWDHDVVVSGLALPNGMGWSPDSLVFYLADSVRHVIYAFDFDLNSGSLTSRRELISFNERDGMPDGLAVDVNGSLWVAMWGGSQVLQVSAAGEILSAIAMPVRQPSSCAFGGDDLGVLYVTSASAGVTPPPTGESLDGSVFAVSGTGTTGLEPARFADGGIN